MSVAQFGIKIYTAYDCSINALKMRSFTGIQREWDDSQH